MYPFLLCVSCVSELSSHYLLYAVVMDSKVKSFPSICALRRGKMSKIQIHVMLSPPGTSMILSGDLHFFRRIRISRVSFEHVRSRNSCEVMIAF